jgi:hypothetical protein
MAEGVGCLLYDQRSCQCDDRVFRQLAPGGKATKMQLFLLLARWYSSKTSTFRHFAEANADWKTPSFRHFAEANADWKTPSFRHFAEANADWKTPSFRHFAEANADWKTPSFRHFAESRYGLEDTIFSSFPSQPRLMRRPRLFDISLTISVEPSGEASDLNGVI